MKLFVLPMIVAMAVLVSAPAWAQDLSGAWAGSYAYDDGQSVSFTANLKSDGDGFSGKTSEPNTFGDRSVKNLTADIEGLIGPNDSVKFTKTYDGAGGISHQVDYNGYLDRDARCISGAWSVGEAGGAFRMCTDTPLIF